jgi:hypothetical protein
MPKHLCHLCAKNFLSLCTLTNHLKAVHNEGDGGHQQLKDDFICDFCGSKYQSKFNLKRHITHSHPKEKKDSPKKEFSCSE